MIMRAALTVDTTASGLPPVATVTTPHPTRCAHSTGYFIAGGVQFTTTPTRPFFTASVGEEAL